MSQHPSLRSSDKDKQHRSVLKRHERVKILKDKEKWEEKDSVFGLPKVKVIKFKIKKEKAAVAEGAEGAVAGPGTEAAAGTAQGPAKTAAAPSAKAAAPAKGAHPAAKPGADAKK